jgi:hypothetical protein
LVWDNHSQVEKVFELPSRIINFEITNLEMNKTNSWIIICVSQKIEREMKDLICLYSIKRDICEFHLVNIQNLKNSKLNLIEYPNLGTCSNGRLNAHYSTDLTAVPYKALFRLAVVTKKKLLLLQVFHDLF